MSGLVMPSAMAAASAAVDMRFMCGPSFSAGSRISVSSGNQRFFRQAAACSGRGYPVSVLDMLREHGEAFFADLGKPAAHHDLFRSSAIGAVNPHGTVADGRHE